MDKEKNKNKDNKKIRTRTIKKHLWKPGLKISQSCNWVLNHWCLWCLNILGVAKSPIMRQIFNPECFSKKQKTDCTDEHQHRSYFRICTKHFCNCYLKMVKKTSWSFFWHKTYWMKLLACWIACCFFSHSYAWQNFTCSRWQGLASLRQWWLDKCQPEDKHDQELEKCHLILTLLSIALWKQNGNTLGAYARVAVMPCK